MNESEPVPTVRRRLQDEHVDVVGAVDRCADAIAAKWPDGGTSTREAVVDPLRTELEQVGVWSRLPTVLSDVVRTAGFSLSAPPVAGPPYVVVTSRGPVLRATLESGRLVIRFGVFAVVCDPDPRYVRREGLELEVSLE